MKEKLCFVSYIKEYSVKCLTCPFCPAIPYVLHALIIGSFSLTPFSTTQPQNNALDYAKNLSKRAQPPGAVGERKNERRKLKPARSSDGTPYTVRRKKIERRKNGKFGRGRPFCRLHSVSMPKHVLEGREKDGINRMRMCAYSKCKHV